MRGILSTSVAFVSLLLLQGCVGLQPTKDPTRYYLLNSVSSDPTGSLSEDGLRIGIRSIEMPSYLHASKIAVRRGSHEIVYSNFNRWGEDIDRAIARGISGELERQLEIYYISVFPWTTGLKHDYQIRASFTHFEGSFDGRILVAGSWVLIEPDSKAILATSPFRIERSWDSQTYSDLSAGLAEGVREASLAIVEAIQQLESTTADSSSE